MTFRETEDHPEAQAARSAAGGTFLKSCLSLRFTKFALVGLVALAAHRAAAAPALVVDVASGNVLYQNQATQPWYPASLTKLMTTYVALSAVRDHRISLDTPLVVSARAAQMPASKMGFAPGTQVTLGNALKMLMVKSANDLAVTIAEGVSGSVEAFADEMNDAAAGLGLTASHFVNPNGLPDPNHYSSARDLAVLGRALYLKFPDEADLYAIGALKLGGMIIPNHNHLIGRYPGADGMKTGFTCPAGFNLVVSASRGGRRYIAVVLGAPSVAQRDLKAAALLDRAFIGIDQPITTLANLQGIGGTPPDMRNEICRRRGKSVAAFNAETDQLMAPLTAQSSGAAGSSSAAMPERTFLFDAAALSRPVPMATRLASVPTPAFEPEPVYLGPAPGYVGPIAQARPPHSPVGTEPPPEAATAYAATPNPPNVSGTPIASDANALPLHGRGRALAHTHALAKAQDHPHIQHAKAEKAKAHEAKGAGKAKLAKVASKPAKPQDHLKPKSAKNTDHGE